MNGSPPDISSLVDRVRTTAKAAKVARETRERAASALRTAEDEERAAYDAFTTARGVLLAAAIGDDQEGAF